MISRSFSKGGFWPILSVDEHQSNLWRIMSIRITAPRSVKAILESEQQRTSPADQVAVHGIIIIPPSQMDFRYLCSFLSIPIKNILPSSEPILYTSLWHDTGKGCMAIAVWCVDSKQESWYVSVSERRHLTPYEGVWLKQERRWRRHSYKSEICTSVDQGHKRKRSLNADNFWAWFCQKQSMMH